MLLINQCLSDTHEVFVWGDNVYGQLGVLKNENSE